MKFLAFSAPAAYALLGGVAALIGLLYWLKPRPPRVVVASNFIWRQLASTQWRVLGRLRWLASLLLALAIGWSLMLALSRPQLTAVGGEAKRTVLVLDNSPSMAARMRDGRRRWDHAVAHARAVVDSAGVDSKFLILDTLGYAGASGFVARPAALATLARLAPASGAARMPPLPENQRDATEVYLFTDAVASLQIDAHVQVQSVYEAASNAAVIAFEAKALPRDPQRYQAFVQVFNASPASRKITLEVSGGKMFRIMRELQVPAGSVAQQTFDVSSFAAGVLRAKARLHGDAFPADDVAYCVVERHRPQRVLLVTPGNRPLEQALKLTPGVQLTLAKPAAYRDMAEIDAYVFDRFAPDRAPGKGALLLRPPPRPWLASAGREVRKPVITQWDEPDAVASAISWRDVRVERAALIQISRLADANTATVLAKGSGEGALMVAHRDEPRWIQVGFALQDSNLALQAGFPVFLGKALQWLTPRTQIVQRTTGTVEVPLPQAAVLDDLDRPLPAVHTAGSTLFEANTPGVFTLKSAQGEQRVVVSWADPRASDINASRFASQAPAPPDVRLRAARWSAEPAWLLLWLAAALMVIEWFTFSRRITL